MPRLSSHSGTPLPRPRHWRGIRLLNDIERVLQVLALVENDVRLQVRVTDIEMRVGHEHHGDMPHGGDCYGFLRELRAARFHGNTHVLLRRQLRDF